MYKCIINSPYRNLESFILNIREKFNQNNNSIHKARNELKVIKQSSTNLVVKSFMIPSFFRSVVYTFFRDSKAKKSYEYSLKIGNYTPHPIGYIEFYKNSLLSDSYFLAEQFKYDFTIREPLLDETFEDKQEILKQFSTFTFDLHQKEILHNDYSPGNILIKKENQKYHFKIVDINRMEFKELTLNERLKNFSKLWISDKDLKVVIHVYAALLQEDKEKCYLIALKYSHKLKNKINMKKRLKGIEVVD